MTSNLAFERSFTELSNNYEFSIVKSLEYSKNRQNRLFRFFLCYGYIGRLVGQQGGFGFLVMMQSSFAIVFPAFACVHALAWVHFSPPLLVFVRAGAVVFIRPPSWRNFYPFLLWLTFPGWQKILAFFLWLFPCGACTIGHCFCWIYDMFGFRCAYPFGF